jgi:aminoglycoside 3-N-acetyltransferase
MPKADTIDNHALPLTFDSLVEQLAACGLAAGQTVLVHSALSRLGWVVGGAVTVNQALLHLLGDDGTLMMPTHTTGNTDPANWRNPPAPESWWQTIRDHMPAYDPAITPTRVMGQIPEVFRTMPNVRRSNHPVASFAARGKHAAALTADHPLTPMLGDGSPIGRLYDLDGYVLLLGVTHENNTSLHLAEYRADFTKKYVDDGTAMRVDGQRQWVPFRMLALNDEDFEPIGAAYEAAFNLPVHRVGKANVRLLRQRPLVDFAVEWMNKHRT